MKGNEVSDVFENEESRSIIIAVGQVRDDERILKLGMNSRVPSIELGESLARRAADEKVDFALLRQSLTPVPFFAAHHQLRKKIKQFKVANDMETRSGMKNSS